MTWDWMAVKIKNENKTHVTSWHCCFHSCGFMGVIFVFVFYASHQTEPFIGTPDIEKLINISVMFKTEIFL